MFQNHTYHGFLYQSNNKIGKLAAQPKQNMFAYSRATTQVYCFSRTPSKIQNHKFYFWLNPEQHQMVISYSTTSTKKCACYKSINQIGLLVPEAQQSQFFGSKTKPIYLLAQEHKLFGLLVNEKQPKWDVFLGTIIIRFGCSKSTTLEFPYSRTTIVMCAFFRTP